MRQAWGVPPASSPPPSDTPAEWISTELASQFAETGTTAHRLASGPDGWVERLGDDVLISHKNDAALKTLIAEFEHWKAEAGWEEARIFSRFLPLKNADRVSPILCSGDPTLPATTVVSEAGTRYEIDFAAGYSHGLFLDQRSNREKLRALRPKRLLNTFAYTCSFSVEAALLGAQTVSVDLSRKSLDRGKQNFILNGIDPTQHRFLADDTLELLPRLGGQNELFDAIILDPPTFSRTRQGRRWQVERHFEDLLDAALEVAMPKCAILLSTNSTKIDRDGLERRARVCAKGKRRTASYMATPSPLDFPAGHGATTLWMILR